MLNKSFATLALVTIILIFALYTNQADAQYVKDGLIGYWSFDADTIEEKTIKDVSGNDNHGTINFDVKTVEGKVGNALECDGESEHFVDTGLMVSEAQYKNLTMMAWVKPYEKHEAWGSVMNGDDGGWDRGYGYRIDAWEIQVGHGGDWQPGPLADINKWQHTVVIYTPTNVIFYKNGERFEFGEPKTPGESTQPLIIGDDKPCGPNCSFPGAIDEVLVYGRALSDAEVQQNYTSRGMAVAPIEKLSLTWGEIKILR